MKALEATFAAIEGDFVKEAIRKQTEAGLVEYSRIVITW